MGTTGYATVLGRRGVTLTIGVSAALAMVAGLAAAMSEPVPPSAPAGMPVESKPAQPAVRRPIVQIALLLDTSNSMDGLINQAKTQLWNIVNEFATAKKGDAKPMLNIALYQYGNDSLPPEAGFIRQELGFTDDLDAVSTKLFALTTNGGSEFCGHVIDVATRQLSWSDNPDDLKVIVVAGNEAFTQGGVDYKASVPTAVKRGIIINTIFCGNMSEGQNSGWFDGARLGEGKFANIDQNATELHIDAPQDARILSLSTLMNDTYLPCGDKGQWAKQQQELADTMNTAASTSVGVQRAASKASGLYVNSTWDLVDGVRDGTIKLEDVKNEDLPEAMRKMTLEEKKAYVAKQREERERIQKEIATLQKERAEFCARVQAEREEKDPSLLKDVIVAAMREQATRCGLTFEKKSK
ncbi:MAG: VWA domain-containing protein [Phycisphaerales bacterium]|nr:MAG: VWA domain-containing protein [Phycisphaerales bacterium]